MEFVANKMQEPRTSSTLELVVDEQQMHNMSQVDLSRPGESNPNIHRQQAQRSNHFSFQQLKEWPDRFRENFNAKIEEAKSKSETKAQFVFELLHAFSSIVIWILCFICTIFVPIILFLIGLINLDNCKDQPPLPYLIFATGFTMTASNLFNLAMALDLPILTNHQILTSEIKNTISSILNIIFNCVVAFLYILSAYMVYTVNINKRKQTVNGTTVTVDYEDQMDCSYLLYFFTFWFITLTLSLLVLLSVIAIIFFAYNKYRLAIIRGSTSKSQPSTNPNPTDQSYTTNGL